MMKNLLIVAHMPSQNLTSMAQAVYRGACHQDISGVETRLVGALQASAEDVMRADAIVLGSSENFGYMSGGMKDFFDRVYYPCLDQTVSLHYALFIRAGNDGSGALSSMERIIKGLGWRSVQPPLICRGDWQGSFETSCEELGMTMAAGLESEIF